MPEHFTGNTISATFWCGKCHRRTQHRIDDHRKGPCLDCIARLEEKHVAAVKTEPERQQELFHA